MYDLLLIDIPYMEYSMDIELQIKMHTYREDCDNSIYRITGVDAKEKENYYSMGLLCMSSFAKKHISDVSIKYYHYYLNDGCLRTYIKQAKIIAFSTMTVTFNTVIRVCEEAKLINPKAKILLGGYHATYFAKEILEQYPSVDWIIKYEGEVAVTNILRGIPFENIEGIAYRDKTGMIKNNSVGEYLCGEDIPIPDYSLLGENINKFNIQIQMARGCVGHCNFCVNRNYWKCPRFRNIDDIVRELLYLKKIFPVGTVIHIIDNVFTINKKRLYEILKALERGSLLNYFAFECDTLASTIDQEVVEILIKMGVFKVGLGFEDCCEKVLSLAGKENFFAKNVAAAMQIKKVSRNICVYAYWLFGLPGSTISTLEYNLQMIRKLIRKDIVDIVSPKIFIPYPGTDFFTHPEKYLMEITSNNWDEYERRNPPFPYKCSTIENTEVYRGLLRAFDICHNEYERKIRGENKMIENWDYNEENALEIWDIYDKDKKKLEYTKHRNEKLNDDEYHLVVRVWIVNSNKEILLSQRGMKKRGPLLWECTAGSAVSGESNIDAINREVFEELGIDLSHDKGICMVDTRRDSHHDFYEVWLYRKDIDLSDVVIDGEEVINVKWIKIDQLIQMIAKNQLMPTLSNFPDLYRKYVE